jgi:hypothetical protein
MAVNPTTGIYLDALQIKLLVPGLMDRIGSFHLMIREVKCTVIIVMMIKNMYSSRGTYPITAVTQVGQYDQAL